MSDLATAWAVINDWFLVEPKRESTFYEPERMKVMQALDTVERILPALAALVEAAEAWADAEEQDWTGDRGTYQNDALAAAVDAYRATTDDQTPDALRRQGRL